VSTTKEVTKKTGQCEATASIVNSTTFVPLDIPRMLFLQVFHKDCDDTYFVDWKRVIGYLTVIKTPFRATWPQGTSSCPDRGATVADMRDKGWEFDPYGEQISIEPIVLGPFGWGELDSLCSHPSGTMPPHEDWAANSRYRALVYAWWPPEQNEENIRRIAREMIANNQPYADSSPHPFVAGSMSLGKVEKKPS
jgi:hypothetical protein